MKSFDQIDTHLLIKEVTELGLQNQDLFVEAGNRIHNLLSDRPDINQFAVSQMKETLIIAGTPGHPDAEIFFNTRIAISKVEVIDNPNDPNSKIVKIHPSRVASAPSEEAVILELARYGDNMPFELHSFSIPDEIIIPPRVEPLTDEEKRVNLVRQILKQIAFGQFTVSSQAEYNFNLMYRLETHLTKWLEDPSKPIPDMDEATIHMELERPTMVVLPKENTEFSPVSIRPNEKDDRILDINMHRNTPLHIERAIKLGERLKREKIHHPLGGIIKILDYEMKRIEFEVSDRELERHLKLCKNALEHHPANRGGSLQFSNNEMNWRITGAGRNRYVIFDDEFDKVIMVDLDPEFSAEEIENAMLQQRFINQAEDPLHEQVTAIRVFPKHAYRSRQLRQPRLGSGAAIFKYFEGEESGSKYFIYPHPDPAMSLKTKRY